MDKITISEFEKELKKIDENVEVVKGDKYSNCDYSVKFDDIRTYTCGFNLGTLDEFEIYYGNIYDRNISISVLNKAIELIPHLVPDDYKEPTIEELFNEFEEEVEENGFYLEIGVFSDYVLRFHSPESRRWIIAEFDKSLKDVDVRSNEDAPIDKYLEGLKLFINYVEKARSLRHIKLYEIPLPGLKTTDGQQQYLSDKDGVQFASRKDGSLKQRWTKEELEEVPEAYREYAVEVEENGL